ncbi:MAG TPA: hypothetical protein VKU38_10155 [Ktedonobacteraceae bacterium]|nr:hypothetical protein [Ktedonobacteraceae bacterium]
MKRSFLSKLHTHGIYYLVGALLLLIGVPLYQFAILNPEGYNAALATVSKGSFVTYLLWLNAHPGQFLGYRILLIVAFALLLSLPFTLFRIIVAQEILGLEDVEQEEIVNDEETTASGTEGDSKDRDAQETDGMPPYAWRGRGFAVIAAWAGLGGVIFCTVGTILSTLYLFIVGSSFSSHEPVQSAFPGLSSTFDILTYTVGGGLLAVALLFFGAIIASRGRHLWPGIWVVFSYLAIAGAALLSGSAVAVASAPTEGQAALTSPAILVLALWVLWLGIMLVRLKPEP